MSYYETLLERDGYPEYEPNNHDTCRICDWYADDWESDAPLMTTIKGRRVERGFCTNPGNMMFVVADDTTAYTGYTCFEPR